MNKIFLGIGAALLGLALMGETKAQFLPPLPPPPPPPGVVAYSPAPVVVTTRPYYLVHGTRYDGGYFYPGRNHRHWQYRVWNSRFGRYHYYDPYLRSYYYYDPARVGYYPIN